MKKHLMWLNKKPWFLPTAGVVAALIMATLIQLAGATSSTREPDFEIDTYIPAGFVLVPISVHNSENVDSMFGTYGMVDLYPINQNGQVSNHAVLRAVKMLRAPRNPNQYGVLVPESMAAILVRSGSTFAVVVLNRQSGGTVFEKEQYKIKRKIILEGD